MADDGSGRAAMAALLPVLVQDAPMEQNTQAVPLTALDCSPCTAPAAWRRTLYSSESIPSAQVCGPRPREDDEVTQNGSFVPDEDDVQSKKSGGFGDTVLETKLVEDMADNLCKFAGATGAGLDEHLVRVHQAMQQDERHHLGKGKPEAAAGRAPTAAEAAEVEQLKKALGEGEVNVRSPLGQKFARQHGPGQPGRVEYEQCVTHEEKRAFRVKWAEQRFEHVSKKQVYSEEFRKIDVKKGTYRPMAYIVTQEGGFADPAATRAAANYVTKCLLMGGAWVCMNDMTDRLEFLYVEQSSTEMMQKSWALYETYRDVDECDVGDSAATQAGEDLKANGKVDVDKRGRKGDSAATKAGEELKANSKVDVDKRRRKGDGAETKATGNKGDAAARKELDDAVKRANKVKLFYQAVHSAARKLLAAIQGNEPEWKWANNEELLGPMQALLEKVKLTSEVHRALLVGDTRMLKASYPAEMLMTELATFATLQSSLQSLQVAHRQLTSMQGARTAASRVRP